MFFFDSIGPTVQLIKNSMALTVKNKAIFEPTMRQIIIGLIIFVLIVFELIIAVFTTGVIQALMFLFIFLKILFLILIFPFIKFYYRAAQSWIVYKTLTGQKVDLASGLNRARQNKGDIIGLTIADIIFTQLANRLKHGSRGGGIPGLIIHLVLSFIGKIVEEAWDLIGNYLLPAAIIPDQSVVDSLKEIPKLKENIPGSLVGVFGIDFAGNAVKSLLAILFVFALVFGVIVFLIFKSFLVAIFVILLYIGVSFVVSIFIDMAKTIYFTTFYVRLTRQNEIAPEFMGDIESYLKIQETKKGPVESKDTKIGRLLPYIEKYRKLGYSNEKIKEFLLKNEWPQDIIEEALKK